LLADADVETDEPLEAASAARLEDLLTTAVLCNDATLQRSGEADGAGVGDPTEIALLDAAAKHDIWREELLERTPEVREDAFDPDSKRMATVHKSNGRYLVAVKGAPEVILSSCNAALCPWMSRTCNTGSAG
jgi:Ca2+-transporting ATPase